MNKIPACLILLSIVLLSIQNSKSEHRLPLDIIPVRYDLMIRLILNKPPYFSGEVLIELECHESTNTIILHSKYLKVEEKRVFVKHVLSASESYFMEITDQRYNTDLDQYVITVEESLEVNQNYEVFIAFKNSSTMDVDSEGFKIINFEAVEKKRRVFITKLFPNNARKFFPCFDDILLKAVFKISVIHSRNFVVYSNMDIISSTQENNRLIRDEFKETFLMSTSSVVVALANFKQVEAPFETPVRFWTYDNFHDEMNIAYTISINALQFYSEYFNTPYPSTKLDILDLPFPQDDHRQNYGLITINSSSVIYHNTSLNWPLTDLIVGICHSMSHQWIGSYVSMSSWNEYWLHEAIARFIEKPCSEIFSNLEEFSYFEYNLIHSFFNVLQNDMWMEKSVLSPENLKFDNELDDQLRNDKGFHLVRLINFIVGDDLFQTSLIEYVSNFKENNSLLDYVWNVFSITANNAGTLTYDVNIKTLMDPYITERGYPLVTVKRNYVYGLVTIEQERFKYKESNESETESGNECWEIPLTYLTEQDSSSDKIKILHFLSCSDDSVELRIDAERYQWVIFNPRLTVLCRTNYDELNWQMLQRTLSNKDEFSKIDVLTRTHLISDMFELAKAGIQRFGYYFYNIQYLIHEDSYLPWSVASDQLIKFRQLVLQSTFFESLKKYIQEILNSVMTDENMSKIDISSQPDYQKYYLKSFIIQTSCIFEIKICQKMGIEFLNNWISNGEENDIINHDNRSVFYCQAIRMGTDYEWRFLWNEYKTTNDSQFNKDILHALGCTANTDILEIYLQWSLSDNILPEDSIRVFGSLSSNILGHELMTNFLRNNFFKIVERLSGSDMTVNSYLAILFDNTKTNEDLNMLNEYTLEMNEFLSPDRKSLEKSMNNADRNVKWLKRNQKTLTEYFKEYVRNPNL